MIYMPKNGKPGLELGSKFGRLEIVSLSHQDDRWRKHYLCVCECGNKKTIQGSLLTSGNTRSCGCLSKDSAKSRALPNDRGVINHIILQYKRHAKDRSIDFDLSYETVDRLVRGSCYYCGVVGGNLKKTKNLKEGFRHNGIDRVDSSKNYTEDNVVSCCGLCNIAKRDMSADEFIGLAKRIASHQDAMADQWGKPAQMEIAA